MGTFGEDGQEKGFHTGVPLDLSDTLEGKVKSGKQKQKFNEFEMWENRQLKNAGMIKLSGHEKYDTAENNEKTLLSLDHELEQEYEVEITEKEPSFLLNQTSRSGQQFHGSSGKTPMEPMRLVREPEGSLQKCAQNA